MSIGYFFLNIKVIYTLLLCKNDEAHSSKGILRMRLECQARVQAVFTWAEFAKSLPAGTSKPATSEKLAKGLIIVKTCLLANFF